MKDRVKDALRDALRGYLETNGCYLDAEQLEELTEIAIMTMQDNQAIVGK